MILKYQDESKPASSSGKNSKTPGLQSRLVATTLLTRVLDDGRNIDALCDREHGLDIFLALSESDCNLARAIVMTALRHHRPIEEAIKLTSNRPLPKKARFLIHSLHVALAQILYMDVPESAAVNLAVSAIKHDKRTTRFKDFANAVLRRAVREEETLKETIDAVPLFPIWFEKQLRKDFGRKKTQQISRILSSQPKVDVTVKDRSDHWAELLDGIVLPNGSIRLRTTKSVRSLAGYEAGEWWVQDVAASLPAKLIELPEASHVLELCAAPGGKTAQLLNAGYKVTALDISSNRLQRLKANLSRLKFEAECLAADILEFEPDTLYDAVLLDAPCSSTGTIRRHPDVLWTRSQSEIAELAELQFRLLSKARSFLKPGGILVFSNCSMFKQEGEDLLARAIKAFPDLTLDKLQPTETSAFSALINGQGAFRSLPFDFSTPEDPEFHGMDGFFACRFIKQA